MTTRERILCALLVAILAVWSAPAIGQAVSKTVLRLYRIYALDAPLDIIGGIQTDPVVTSTVHTADGGLLVLDGGGVVTPCSATLPACSATSNSGAKIRDCTTQDEWICGIITPTIGYAWRRDGPQVYTFASKSGIGGVAVPQEGQVFSSSTPPFQFVTILAMECGITLEGSGAGQAVLVAAQDAGTKCRFNFPCTETLNAPVPRDGGIWPGPYFCEPNEIVPCFPPGPCSPTQVYYHADSTCAANGLPGITCDVFYQSYRKI